VLVGLLAHVAKTQNSVLGFSLLFTFAIGMGLLLIAIGTFSSLASKLPKSGVWMDGVKFVFGTAMIGMALFYIEPIIPDSAFYLLFGLSAILISSSFGAFEAMENLTTIPLRIRKGLMVLGFILGIIYTVRGLMYKTPFVLPSAAVTPSAESGEKLWQAYSENEFQAALQSNEPIIIDFWAEWCAACKELEKFTFSDLEVQKKLGKFKAFKVDMTVDNAENTTIREKFKILGLPTLRFYNSGKAREDLTLTGFEAADDFKVRLNNVLENR
jgi:thiol:disulfide interchange protein DsbD